MKKKVLILAYDFPPYVSVGALRPWSWYEHLLEYGIEPIVVTRQWSNENGSSIDYVSPSLTTKTIIEKTVLGTIIKTAYFPNFSNQLMLKYGESRFGIVRKIISAFYDIGQFIFPIGTKRELYLEAKKVLKETKVDAIIASGEPFVLFKYASKLSRHYSTPWIADYRDPWTQDKSRGDNKLRETWDSYIENKYLSNVQAITTVDLLFKNKIASLIKNKTIHILPNGYNSTLIKKIANIEQTNEKLSIAFVGTIYKWHPVESFLNEALKFVNKKPGIRLQINFYGINNELEIKEMLSSKYQALIPFVKIHPKLPNQVLLEKMAKNNLLLLFNYYSYMGTKIYDYLALKRKIILCYSNDLQAKKIKEKYYNMDELGSNKKNLQEDIIKETNSGIVVTDSVHLALVLEDCYTEFIEKGSIACSSINIERFSRKIQVEKLATLIKSI